MYVNYCRLCDGYLSNPKIKFPDCPISNEFLTEKKEQELFPLQVCYCKTCGHYQLNESVDPEKLFQNDYPFMTGTSASNVEYFKIYAQSLVKKYQLQPGDLVIDLASNDGTFLKHFKDLGMRVLGVEPAKNIAEIANKNGIETIPDFFDQHLAWDIIKKYGKPKLVTANNVLAHLSYVKDFINGVKDLIEEQGNFIFEVSYFVDVYQNLLLDTIYLEHESYYCVTPLFNFFKNIGLMINDVERTSPHGGSLRCHISSNSKFSNNVLNLIKLETNLGLQSPVNEVIDRTMFEFNQKIQAWKQKVTSKLQEIIKQDQTICIYGFPAKAVTLSYFLEFRSEDFLFAIEDNKLKQNKYSPGKHIKIMGSEELYTHHSDYCLVLAWNFFDSIYNQHKKYQGKWIKLLPDMKVI